MSINTLLDYETIEPVPDYSESVSLSEVLIEAGGPTPLYMPRAALHTYPRPIDESHDNFSDVFVTNQADSIGSSASLPYDSSGSASMDSRFIYASGTILLDLGHRNNNLGTPSYGQNSNIQGWVRIKTMKHVQAVVVKVSLILIPTIWLHSCI
jgi:hypothetical protein